MARTSHTTRLAALLALFVTGTTLAQEPLPAGPAAAQAASPLPPDLAFADPVDPNPGSGRRKLIAGWIGMSVAAVNLAQIPFCVAHEFDGWWNQRRCVSFSASLAAASLGLGTTLLVFGYRQRRAQAAWMERHGLSPLSRLRPFMAPGGAGLAYGATFSLE